MATDLCELWSRLASKPGDVAVAEEARRRLVEFVLHVDDCDRCRAVSETIAAPDEIFAALSGTDRDSLPDHERELLEAGHRAFDEGSSAIEEAVTTSLLPSLPDALQPPRAVTPMQLFMALDAVNLLARSASAEYPKALLLMTAGGLFAGDDRVATRAELVEAISRHASVGSEVGDDLLTWQLNACLSCSQLYRGLLTMAVDGGVLLARTASKSAEELAARWYVPNGDEVEVPSQVGQLLPEPLFEAVEAVGSVLGAELPALQQVGMTLKDAGEPELGTFLVVQSEEEKNERAELIGLLADYEKGRINAALKQRDDSGRKFVVPKGRLVKSQQAYSLAQVVMKRANTRRRLYSTIAACQPDGRINITPLQMFARKGIKRADRDLQYLAHFTTPGAKFYVGD